MKSVIQVSQQLRDPARFGVVGQHGQVLDLGPDGEVGFVGRVLPLQGNQHIGKGGGVSHDLPDLLLQVLGLAALQEQIALDSPTSVGLAGQSKKPAKILSDSLRSLPVNSGRFTTILEVAIAFAS